MRQFYWHRNNKQNTLFLCFFLLSFSLTLSLSLSLSVRFSVCLSVTVLFSSKVWTNRSWFSSSEKVLSCVIRRVQLTSVKPFGLICRVQLILGHTRSQNLSKATDAGSLNKKVWKARLHKNVSKIFLHNPPLQLSWTVFAVPELYFLKNRPLRSGDESKL